MEARVTWDASGLALGDMTSIPTGDGLLAFFFACFRTHSSSCAPFCWPHYKQIICLGFDGAEDCSRQGSVGLYIEGSALAEKPPPNAATM